MKFKRLLVTAALPYANGKIHLGHLAGAYLPADIYVRYQRSREQEVVFICGSDEHGVAITISADQEKISPQAVVDRYHALNKDAFEKFGMSFDNYSRTTLPLHHETAREFFLKLHASGILRLKKENQFFDEQAKMFLPDRYVAGTCPICGYTEATGDQCEKCGSFLNPSRLLNPRSKLTGKTPAVRETQHLYFPLGEFQKKLEKYVKDADERDGWKENVLQYCRSWFRDGLEDRAVTRDLEWGVKVPLPGFEHKVLYVWFDAVLGYISSTKEWAARTGKAGWKDYWLDSSTKYVAFIGKDNVVFHCIVFPAMLMAWNDASKDRYILPENVPANEFLNFEGQKFSKSRGWGIDVDEFLEEFPADALRYTLTMNLPESRDADFTWKDFQARTNNELADILGNFVNRTLTFAAKHFGKVPPRGALSPRDQAFIKDLKDVPSAAGQLIEKYRFREATAEMMNLARSANKYFNDSEPWKTIQSDPGRCATTINLSLQTVRALAILFFPVIPSSAEKIWAMLGLSGGPAPWSSASELALPDNSLLGKQTILFGKIEDEAIDRHIRKLGGGAPGLKPTIGVDIFGKIDLRVARVLRAEKIPKSDKLLKLTVSIGSEERQVVAGIAQHYAPENLLGKKIIVVANLAPAKLMGQVSQGMLLAASNSEGKLSILTVDGDIEEGGIVR